MHINKKVLTLKKDDNYVLSYMCKVILLTPKKKLKIKMNKFN